MGHVRFLKKADVKVPIMMESHEQRIWGILGGLGPLASAEFLNRIYRYAAWNKEQDAPRLILISDPTFYDRTESFLQGREDRVRHQLQEGLQTLRKAGATHIIICCFTMHYLVPKLSPLEAYNLISLVDVALRSVLSSPEKHLLLCTRGAMQLEIFQQHPLWRLAAPQIVVPHESDWEAIHDLIYAIKCNRVEEHRQEEIVGQFLERYGVKSFIAGCTELHMLTRHLQRRKTGSLHWLDPLDLLARQIAASTHVQYAEQASIVS